VSQHHENHNIIPSGCHGQQTRRMGGIPAGSPPAMVENIQEFSPRIDTPAPLCLLTWIEMNRKENPQPDERSVECSTATYHVGNPRNGEHKNPSRGRVTTEPAVQQSSSPAVQQSSTARGENRGSGFLLPDWNVYTYPSPITAPTTNTRTRTSTQEGGPAPVAVQILL
jgi:hypothetical protein